MKKIYQIHILLFLIVINIIFLFIWFQPSVQLIISGGKTSYNFQDFENNLDKLIDQWGPEPTIQLVKTALQKKQITINECHILTHLVGHKAYSLFHNDMEKLINEVDDALLVCGGAFPHGIEAEIALLPRSDLKSELKNLCELVIKRVWFPCYHGAGHAFMQESSDIQSSLTNCDKLIAYDRGRDPAPCYTGVFSEFAFILAGVDSNTGKAYPGGPRIELPSTPMEFCQTIDEKYQVACASQLGRLILDNPTLENPFAECINVKYSVAIQENCVNIVSARIAQFELAKNNTVVVPNYILTLSDSYKMAYIRGIAGEYWSYWYSGVKNDWQTICRRFDTKIKAECTNMLRTTI